METFLDIAYSRPQGSLIPRHLPHTSSNNIIKTFRHAIAIDERRSKFNVNIWAKQVEQHDEHTFRRAARRKNTWYEMGHASSVTYGRGQTDAFEVWFAGTHAGTCLSNYPQRLG